MSGFQTQTTAPATIAPDPFKHVKYSLGMVLGADDFDQEFAYLSNRDQWLARDAIGYGTVCGLKVNTNTDDRGPRVDVEPGVAINPRGQLMRVTTTQCASINDWLNTHREKVLHQVGASDPAQLLLYVVLCYRPCPVDPVPIPGEPCRDENEATVDSRIQDDYELKLSFTAPDQTEEKALRDFVQWLSQVEIGDGATSVTRAQFLEMIREAAHLWESSPLSPLPDFMYGSPLSSMVVNHAEAGEYLRDAFRVWVTELRGRWRSQACSSSAPDEECVLLAELDLSLVQGQVLDKNSIRIYEERRPYLIHLRMLQEWLMVYQKHSHNLKGDVSGPLGANKVEGIQNVPVDPTAPVGGQLLKFDGIHWRPGDLSGDVTPDPLLSSEGYWVTGLSGNPIDNSVTPAEDQVLTFLGGKWTPRLPVPPALPNLDGDVTGSPTANSIEKMRGFDVSSTTPSEGQVLLAASNEWRPVELHGDITRVPTNPADPTTIGKYTVTGLSSSQINITGLDDGNVLIYDKPNNQWVPGNNGGTASGDFVEHPPRLPKFFIEAAGIVRADRQPPQPAFSPPYNGLFAQAIGTSTVLVHFDGYARPLPDSPTHQYIIKAMPVFDPEIWEGRFTQPVVNFIGYRNTNDDTKGGILLHVTDLGKPINRDPVPGDNTGGLTELSFVIEVSRYDAPSRQVPGPALIDVNTATDTELDALPGIGPVLARRIVEARERAGGFSALDDLLTVPGITRDLLEHIRPSITIR